MSLFADVIAGGLLIVSGANVPLDRLPEAVQRVSSVVPLTHGIEAARSVAEGADLAAVSGLLGKEVAIGAVYMTIGLALVVLFEREPDGHVHGADLAAVSGLLGKEVAIGAVYMTIGLALVVLFEREGRRTGALERF